MEFSFFLFYDILILRKKKENGNKKGKRTNENDHPDTLVNSLSFYNRRLKHRLLIGLLAVLLLFTPFIVLGIGEMGIVKWMPSYTTVAMKHTTKQLLLALQEYDYDQLEALLGSNGNVDIGIEKQEHYTSQEIIRRLHDLEDSGVRFQNFSFDQSSYGTMVGFSVDIVYKGVNYLDGYCIMRKNAPFSNFSFIMFLPDHDFEKEIASKIENVFFPGSEFFTL